MTSITNAPHNYRWYHGDGKVTVLCTKCDVRKSFTPRDWNKCIEWCNTHTRKPGK